MSLTGPKSWGVAVLCSVLNFLHLGTARLSGTLYLAVLERYHVDRSKAALPFILSYTVRNISGPLVGYLSTKLGIYTVTLLGGLIAFLGIGCCYFAEDIVVVILFWGIIFGFGFGMGSVLIPEILNHHFDKYVSNANGIAFGGECIAGFVLPILLKFSLSAYGISGTFLILSGLMLNSIPASLMIKYLSKNQSHRIQKTIFEQEIDRIPEASGYNDHTSNLYTKRKSMNANLLEANSSNFSKAGSQYVPNKSYGSLDQTVKKFGYSSEGLSDLLIPSSERATNSQLNNGLSVNFTSEQTPSSSPFKIFLNPAFCMILLTQSTMLFIATMFWTIIVDFSRDSGLSSREEIYVLTFLSVLDMIGRLGLGWITDAGYISNTKFSGICCFGTGIAVGSLVFFKKFATIGFSVSVFGLCFGGFLIVCPGVVNDHIHRSQRGMALASRFFLFAPMSLSQSPLIGYFRGKLGSYDCIFVILAVLCTFSCITSLLTPYAEKCKSSTNNGNLGRSFEAISPTVGTVGILPQESFSEIERHFAHPRKTKSVQLEA